MFSENIKIELKEIKRNKTKIIKNRQGQAYAQAGHIWASTSYKTMKQTG